MTAWETGSIRGSSVAVMNVIICSAVLRSVRWIPAPPVATRIAQGVCEEARNSWFFVKRVLTKDTVFAIIIQRLDD